MIRSQEVNNFSQMAQDLDLEILTAKWILYSNCQISHYEVINKFNPQSEFGYITESEPVYDYRFLIEFSMNFDETECVVNSSSFENRITLNLDFHEVEEYLKNFVPNDSKSLK